MIAILPIKSITQCAFHENLPHPCLAKWEWQGGKKKSVYYYVRNPVGESKPASPCRTPCSRRQSHSPYSLCCYGGPLIENSCPRLMMAWSQCLSMEKLKSATQSTPQLGTGIEWWSKNGNRDCSVGALVREMGILRPLGDSQARKASSARRCLLGWAEHSPLGLGNNLHSSRRKGRKQLWTTHPWADTTMGWQTRSDPEGQRVAEGRKWVS